MLDIKTFLLLFTMMLLMGVCAKALQSIDDTLKNQSAIVKEC